MLREDFEDKAREILKEVCEDAELEVSDLVDVEKFQDAIWNDKDLLQRIGERLFESLSDWNGDETFDKVRKELLKNLKKDENEEY